jgi:nitrogen fixation protein NifX
MTDTALPRAIALRIGLAARALPDTDPARLLRVLEDLIGLPPTEERLAALRVKDLEQAADGELAELDTATLKQALTLLKGEGLAPEDPLPDVEPYAEGDLPGSIRVACASDRGEELNGHFGSCRRFLIYQVSAAACRLIAVRPTDRDRDAEDKNAFRAALIGDCQVLFVGSIGGPAAAKVIKAGVHPIKHPEAGPARTQIETLAASIAKAPPPWLAKAMGQAPEERVRFERVQAEA